MQTDGNGVTSKFNKTVWLVAALVMGGIILSNGPINSDSSVIQMFIPFVSALMCVKLYQYRIQFLDGVLRANYGWKYVDTLDLKDLHSVEAAGTSVLDHRLTLTDKHGKSITLPLGFLDKPTLKLVLEGIYPYVVAEHVHKNAALNAVLQPYSG